MAGPTTAAVTVAVDHRAQGAVDFEPHLAARAPSSRGQVRISGNQRVIGLEPRLAGLQLLQPWVASATKHTLPLLYTTTYPKFDCTMLAAARVFAIFRSLVARNWGFVVVVISCERVSMIT